MQDAVVVRYRTVSAEAGEANAESIAAVFAELAEKRPPGLTYVAVRLADGVSFVHLAIGDGRALGGLAAFAEFQRAGEQRRAVPPEVTPGSVVGVYQS
jgi:hypothetical protein